MLRKLLSFFCVALLIISSLTCAVWVYRVPLVSWYLSKSSSMHIEIAQLDLNLKKIEIKGLKVYLDSRKEKQLLFSLNRLGLEFPLLQNYRPIHIKQILMENPQLSLQGYLLAHNQKKQSTSSPKIAASSKQGFIRVDNVLIKNFTIDANNPLLKKKKLSIPSIEYLEIKDIGSSHPITFKDLIKEIGLKIMHVFSKKGADILIQNLANFPIDTAEEILNVPQSILKNIFKFPSKQSKQGLEEKTKNWIRKILPRSPPPEDIQNLNKGEKKPKKDKETSTKKNPNNKNPWKELEKLLNSSLSPKKNPRLH